MKTSIVFLCFGFLAIANCKSIEPVVELVETKWMDRVYEGPSSMITNGEPGKDSEFEIRKFCGTFFLLII